MNFFQQLGVIWQNVSLVQKAMLAAIVMTFVIIGALLVHWAGKPDMRVLYSNLDTKEAAKIAEKIGEKSIVYKLANGGTTIYVPKENVSQLRLDMAKDGLPEGGQKGYRLFDNEKIGISPFVQNVNLKRALQDELAKSIQMIEGVVHARVHIVGTEQKLFASETSQTSASVVLRLRAEYRLSALNIAAVTHLVAGSVEGLKAENVTIIDSQGRLLSSESDNVMAGNAGTVADYRERVEQNLASKVEDMLTAVLGPDRAKVRVSAEIDMTSTSIAKEIFDEGKKVPKKEEIKSESEVEVSKASTEDGSAVPSNTKKGETISTEYAVPKTIRQIVELPGEIKSLTVAAFVDLSPPEKIETEQSETGETEAETEAATEPIMAISDVEEIIRKVLGPKLKENGLKVVDVRFNRPAVSLIGHEEAGGLDFIAIARQASLGIMAICALLVLKIFTKTKKKQAATAATQQLPGTTAGPLLAGASSTGSLVLRTQIASELQNNPERVKQLFLNWLEEKGG